MRIANAIFYVLLWGTEREYLRDKNVNIVQVYPHKFTRADKIEEKERGCGSIKLSCKWSSLKIWISPKLSAER